MAGPVGSGCKVIALTGATRGLGRALAIRLAGLGHAVAGCGRSADLVAGLGEALGPGHDVRAVDVADDRAVAAWASGLIGRFRPPDLLINNAAVIAPNAPAWKVDAAAFGRLIDINVKGVASAIRHLAPAMIARGSGVIANLSSGWGRSASAGVAAYCASKWAIEGFTAALALDLPPGLAAVAVNPGIIDTEMLRATFGDRASAYPGPDEWAARAAPFFLALGPADNGRPASVPGGGGPP